MKLAFLSLLLFSLSAVAADKKPYRASLEDESKKKEASTVKEDKKKQVSEDGVEEAPEIKITPTELDTE